MKTFSNQGTVPDPGTLERMSEDMSRLLPREMAGAVNLLAHPLAGAAAFSALGIGLASHAFGIWFGAASSAAEMSERILRTVEHGMASRIASFGDERDAAEAASEAAMESIADAGSTAPAAQGVGAGTASHAAVDEPPALGSGRAASVVAFPGQKPAVRPADDLKAIKGIGPRLEQVLNGLGVARWAEIAAWDEADIARISAQLPFNGRVERDDWIGQAKALAESGR